jgi:CRISPR-associated protein Cas1
VSDFSKTKDAAKPVLLSDDAVERVIKAYEDRVTTRVRHPLTGEQVTYRRCFELQTRLMARVIQGEASGYRAMVLEG